uniref:Peptidase M1 membrane alanine aminopeptidase domain-containing protein n=1 Tax=Panagrolaimus davidi TaxID=227884 RepID=A0A914Q0Z0_9BILA
MGGAVIRQSEAVISPEILQKGLQSYIHKFQFSNANYQQLLDEIQNAVDETELKDWCGEAFNVTNFMNLWLNQEGHPCLNVDYLNGTFLITQNVQNGTNEKLWPLPVFVQLNNNQKRIYWSAPNYVCKNNRILPKTLKIKTDVLFVNRDILSVASTYYSTKAIQVIVDALTTFTTNLQLLPASLHAFINDVFFSAVKNGTPKAHLKNILSRIYG